ncbi:BRO family protein [Rhodocyclus gracilis]
MLVEALVAEASVERLDVSVLVWFAGLDQEQLHSSRGGPTNIISESGLYKLIMRSDKATAKPFQDFVTKEVLPSIRKTGAYVTGQPRPVVLSAGASVWIEGRNPRNTPRPVLAQPCTQRVAQ